MRHLPAACALLVLAAAAETAGQLPDFPPPGFVLVGDMVVSNEVAAAVNEGRWRPQGSLAFQADERVIPPWPYGIIPVSFSPEVSAERQAMFLANCARWGTSGLIFCVPRTTETKYVLVSARGESCGATVGAYSPSTFNFGAAWCWNDSSVAHDIGHTIGFIHEHQRADRDTYVFVDLDNVLPEFRSAYTIWSQPTVHNTPYDFDSLMHYPAFGYNVDPAKPSITPRPAYAAAGARMGRATAPSPGDFTLVSDFYRTQLKAVGAGRPTLPVQTRFNRDEFLGAMNRLHALYTSTLGLSRPNGLSIGGRPDFLGIATWIFDLYLGARSAGFDSTSAFDIVVASVTQTDEWKQKHPGAVSLSAASFTPYVRFDRAEFLSALNQLDAFYSSREGLQRPNGLSLNGAPDFTGIATWIFDVYLNQRLTGGSPTAAWLAVENAIAKTDEWRSKH